MTFLRSIPGRAFLAVMFFVFVNGLSGLLAQELRYPSLWGNSSGLFGEYAYPIPFTYALSHWLSMGPLTLIVLGIPLWERKALLSV